jgi:cysteine synthase A
MKIYDNILQTIGKTPVLKLNSINIKNNVTILAKLEYFNPTSSVKDRIALNMINKAEKEGLLKPGATIVEPTSGNTGLGLAMVAAARGYKLIITMPETMSIERRHLLRHLGADILLTPGETGMTGAVQKAEEILKNTPGAFMPAQFSNPANPESHYTTTAPEIWEDTDGLFDIFTAAVGTGGTLIGCGKFFKEKNKKILIAAVEPANSAILSGKTPGKHSIQGIGAGFIPEVIDKDLIDKVITVNDSDAFQTSKILAEKEGILCGISSGANVYAALKLAEKPENKNKTIVTVICDTGERYLSTDLFI